MMPGSQLPHADRTQSLLRQGRRAEAISQHNAHVEETLNAAKAGAVINLSDLMAGREAFILDEIERGDDLALDNDLAARDAIVDDLGMDDGA